MRSVMETPAKFFSSLFNKIPEVYKISIPKSSHIPTEFYTYAASSKNLSIEEFRELMEIAVSNKWKSIRSNRKTNWR